MLVNLRDSQSFGNMEHHLVEEGQAGEQEATLGRTGAS